jgi:hypothetical protein
MNKKETKPRKPRSKRYKVVLEVVRGAHSEQYYEVQKWLKENIGNCIQDGHTRYVVSNYANHRMGIPVYSFAREEDAMMFALRWK